MEGISRSPSRAKRHALVRAAATACEELGVIVLAEGIETAGESATLRELGVDLQQGYFFARPAFEALPAVALAKRAAAAA